MIIIMLWVAKNMCYGTKQHLDAKDYGISPLHRQTFGICTWE